MLKQLIFLTVLGFAILGFVAVPLGKKTGLNHARDFWAKPSTQEAADQIQQRLEAATDEMDAELKKREEEAKANRSGEHDQGPVKVERALPRGQKPSQDTR